MTYNESEKKKNISNAPNTTLLLDFMVCKYNAILITSIRCSLLLQEMFTSLRHKKKSVQIRANYRPKAWAENLSTRI